MDLTRLYNLTTPELREEAERLGVSDTYALSRAQLIHAIRSKVGGPPADGFLGRVLGFAKWAFQSAGPQPREQAPAEAASPKKPEAGETDEAPREPTMRFIRPSSAPPASAAPRSAPPPMPSVAPSSSPPPVPTVARSATAPASGSASGPAAAPGSEPAAAPASAPATPAPSPTAAPPPPPEAAQASTASRAPAGVFSTSGAPFEEPFPTRTMARILAEQGHYKRALAIYATLMRAEPDDPELREEADAVQSRSRARRSHLH